MTSLAPEELANLVEFGEAVAYADLNAAAADFASTTTIGSAVCLQSNRPDIILFNRVVGLGLREPATEEMADAIVTKYREKGARNFTVQLSPSAMPENLPQWLTERNLLPKDRWSKVYRTTENPPVIESHLRIELIGRDHADEFASVAVVAFGMPDFLKPWISRSIDRAGWRHYAGFEGTRMVATGALYVRERIGWLGLGSTLPSHRRLGAQGALMARRIRDAAEMGCRWVITETGEDTPAKPNPSFHNMVRSGFQVAYHRINYVYQAMST